jgi:hypothetical protein
MLDLFTFDPRLPVFVCGRREIRVHRIAIGLLQTSLNTAEPAGTQPVCQNGDWLLDCKAYKKMRIEKE